MSTLPKILTTSLTLSILAHLPVQMSIAEESAASGFLSEQMAGETATAIIDPILDKSWPMIDETAYNKYWAIRQTMPDLSESVPEASDFATIYYIDPSANEAGDGLSPESPFNSWTQITFQEDTAYLQKCGTSQTLEIHLQTSSNVLLGAYGEGARPILIVTETLPQDHAAIMAGSNNVTIRDLNIQSPNLAACIKLGNVNMTAYNNVLNNSIWGIRGYGEKYNIFANIIHNIADDGMYLKDAGDLDIGWNYVFHINTKWIPPYTPNTEAGGDCVQLSTCSNWHVHHNVLDRRTSGNKFTFISNDGSGSCVFEYNYSAGPLSTGDGGAGIYFGGTHEQVDVLYNHIDRSIGAIYSHSRILNVYGNVITNCIGGVYRASGSESDTIQNNVFYNIEKAIIQKGDTVINNILDNRAGKINLVQYESALKNNLFMGSRSGDSSNFSADPGFVDPERLNFRLRPDSPAIDAGAETPIDQDMDGIPIPQGASPDIGAFEYHGDGAVSWTDVFSTSESGWKLTLHGYVDDQYFPWFKRRSVIIEEPQDSSWVYVHEDSLGSDGFFAYDYALGTWIWVSRPFSPWIYAFTDSPHWQKWS